MSSPDVPPLHVSVLAACEELCACLPNPPVSSLRSVSGPQPTWQCRLHPCDSARSQSPQQAGSPPCHRTSRPGLKLFIVWKGILPKPGPCNSHPPAGWPACKHSSLQIVEMLQFHLIPACLTFAGHWVFTCRWSQLLWDVHARWRRCKGPSCAQSSTDRRPCKAGL